jgi:hypothetical protein
MGRKKRSRVSSDADGAEEGGEDAAASPAAAESKSLYEVKHPSKP